LEILLKGRKGYSEHYPACGYEQNENKNGENWDLEDTGIEKGSRGIPCTK